MVETIFSRSTTVVGDDEVILSASEVEDFAHNGFLQLDSITSRDEIERIVELYDDLFARQAGWETGDYFDFVGRGEARQVASLPQLLNPSRYEPRLRDTLFRRNAASIARQLLGPSAELVFEHAMMKPPGSTGATPWHQDEASYPRYTNYKSITFWMPLQDVARQNGCLEFIPKSHLGPLIPHHCLNNDPQIPGLEADHVDTATAVCCPLPAGGATIHHCRTLHYAGPNRSAGPRRAYALGFGVRSRAHTVRTEYPWAAGKLTASAQRALASQGALRRSVSKLKLLAKAAYR